MRSTKAAVVDDPFTEPKCLSSRLALICSNRIPLRWLSKILANGDVTEIGLRSFPGSATLDVLGTGVT